VLEETSRNVFVPLTIGGGIRDFTDKNGRTYTALEVAAEYFRSGADKVSIGSDAVYIAEAYLKTGQKTGQSAIEQISYVYGNQAVVISIDPRRVYVHSPDQTPHVTVETTIPRARGPAVLLVPVHRERGAGRAGHGCRDAGANMRKIRRR
jgi:glutamine amidotransferase/cyclase